ncbi:MAG: hypothetical protein LBK29_01740 [Oscillospiraceae bacterium]|jgi:hypothetical protein|nr:hypothetical protein [Oscillospiraceae bacterium]
MRNFPVKALSAVFVSLAIWNSCVFAGNGKENKKKRAEKNPISISDKSLEKENKGFLYDVLKVTLGFIVGLISGIVSDKYLFKSKPEDSNSGNFGAPVGLSGSFPNVASFLTAASSNFGESPVEKFSDD